MSSVVCICRCSRRSARSLSTRDQRFSRERNVGGFFRDFHSNCHIEKIYTVRISRLNARFNLWNLIFTHFLWRTTNKKNSLRFLIKFSNLILKVFDDCWTILSLSLYQDLTYAHTRRIKQVTRVKVNTRLWGAPFLNSTIQCRNIRGSKQRDNGGSGLEGKTGQISRERARNKAYNNPRWRSNKQPSVGNTPGGV